MRNYVTPHSLKSRSREKNIKKSIIINKDNNKSIIINKYDLIEIIYRIEVFFLTWHSPHL